MSGPNKLPPRPKAASLFMAVPIVFLGALGLAVAVLFGLTRFGAQQASGDSVIITFSASCIADARAQLLARADQIGMPATMEGGAMTATLPDMPDAANVIPELMVRQGRLSVVDSSGETVFDNGHIDAVAIDLDEAGMPVTMLKLNAEARAALKDMDVDIELQPEIDGEAFPKAKVSDLQETPELSFPSGSGKTSDRMKRAADRAIILEHGPLPCRVHVTDVAINGASG